MLFLPELTPGCCNEARLAHFALEIAVSEYNAQAAFEGEEPKPAGESTSEHGGIVQAKKHRLQMGAGMLKVLIAHCNECDVVGAGLVEACPNVGVFGFIVNTMIQPDSPEAE